MARFAKSDVRRFAVAVHQNVHLPSGGRTVEAVVEVTSSGGGSPSEAALRIWTPTGARVVEFGQVAPSVADLTGDRVESDAHAGDYATGRWGDECRDFRLTVRVPAARVGEGMLAARVAVVHGPPTGASTAPTARGLVRALWSDDAAAAARVDPRVAHYRRQTELVRAVRQGLAARRAGDEDTATARLGLAVRLAGAYGNDETADLLATVVDVLDAATGTVRLKTSVAEVDEMALETRSTRTVRVKK